jgi:hypothetical protein
MVLGCVRVKFQKIMIFIRAYVVQSRLGGVNPAYSWRKVGWGYNNTGLIVATCLRQPHASPLSSCELTCCWDFHILMFRWRWHCKRQSVCEYQIGNVAGMNEEENGRTSARKTLSELYHTTNSTYHRASFGVRYALVAVVCFRCICNVSALPNFH